MNLAIELITNFCQAIIFTGFLYLFFDKPQGKLIKQLLPFWGTVLCLSLWTSIYTLLSMYYTNIIDAVVYILIMEVYTLFFLKGALYNRFLLPVIAYTANILVSYSYIYISDSITGFSVQDAITEYPEFRYFSLVVVNLTFLLVLWIILKVFSKKIHLSSPSEVVSFMIIPVLCMVVIICDFFIYQKTNYDSSFLPYILVSGFTMVFTGILFGVMLIRISKANTAKTQLLLSQQHENLYEQSILATNDQIEQISAIKHNMKNQLMTINRLISQNEYDKALTLCQVSLGTLNNTFTPINTENPILNAIVNVELEKAASLDIDFSVEITDCLEKINPADVVSLVGNLCDNAIEYLSSQPKELRVMSLRIYRQINFSVIVCKNKISSSILKENPNMTTTKKDTVSHGIGLQSVRNILKSYGGNLEFKENEKNLLASIILCCE